MRTVCCPAEEEEEELEDPKPPAPVVYTNAEGKQWLLHGSTELALPGQDKPDGCSDWIVQEECDGETGTARYELKSLASSVKVRRCDVLLAGRKAKPIMDETRKAVMQKIQEKYDVDKYHVKEQRAMRKEKAERKAQEARALEAARMAKEEEERQAQESAKRQIEEEKAENERKQAEAQALSLAKGMFEKMKTEFLEQLGHGAKDVEDAKPKEGEGPAAAGAQDFEPKRSEVEAENQAVSEELADLKAGGGSKRSNPDSPDKAAVDAKKEKKRLLHARLANTHCSVSEDDSGDE